MNNILGAVRNQLRATGKSTPAVFQQANSMSLTASVDTGAGGSMGGAGGPSSFISTVWPSQYQYYFTGILPADPNLSDPSSLALFWRDIYLYDSVGGSCVDLMTSMPFSDFTLHGVDHSRKSVYEDAISQLSLREMFSTISWAHLVDGFFCGTTIYDVPNRRFSDTMIHDALQCSIRTSPFWNRDPNITVTTSNAVAQFLANSSDYNRNYLESLPSAFKELLSEGRFDLNPATTLFVPRKTMTDRPYVSYLHRLLPMYLIEKSLYRGTLTEIQRRQRAMSLITSGDGEWTPNGAELNAILQQFMQAEYDPLGGWISTRNSVQVQDIRPAGDFLKWMDVSDQLTQYKLRALGISEAFLGSEGVTFQAHESSYSMFLEGLNEFREKMTARVFYQRLFPMVAIINGFYKDAKSVTNKNFTDYFYNASDRANLVMPRLQWKKSLEADTDQDKFDLLEKASEHGVPVPLLRYLAAADIEPDALMRELEEDVKLRKSLERLTGKDTSHDRDTDASSDYDLEASYRRMPTLPMSKLREFVPKVPLLSRFGNTPREVTAKTRTGRTKSVPSVMQAELRRKENEAIASISARVKSDPNYRLTLMKNNSRKLGKFKHNMG